MSQPLELGMMVQSEISRFFDQTMVLPPNLFDLATSQVEKPLIERTLRNTRGNQVHAANILGINRNTLRKKMKRYGIAVVRTMVKA